MEMLKAGVGLIISWSDVKKDSPGLQEQLLSGQRMIISIIHMDTMSMELKMDIGFWM